MRWAACCGWDTIAKGSSGDNFRVERIARIGESFLQEAPLDYLDYASPRIERGNQPLFRTVLAVLAVLGFAANLGFIGLSTQQVHQAGWLYHDLKQNPRAYGREIDPQVIASLRSPTKLWIAYAAFVIALGFGMLLAIHLLGAIRLLRRDYRTACARLGQYRRWKPVGIVLTAITLTWSGREIQNLWSAATRHIPVGSGGPPFVPIAILVLCAMLPWWWIGRSPA